MGIHGSHSMAGRDLFCNENDSIGRRTPTVQKGLAGDLESTSRLADPVSLIQLRSRNRIHVHERRVGRRIHVRVVARLAREGNRELASLAQRGLVLLELRTG